jgi:hypothetical protein
MRALAPLLLIGTGACVNPIWELELVDPTINHPPVLLFERMEPQPSQDPVSSNIGLGCTAQDFRVTALDYDGDEQLFYKWLLTARLGDESTPPLTRQLEEDIVVASLDDVDVVLAEGDQQLLPDARYYPDISLTLDAETLRLAFDPSQLASSGNTHLLELVVSDRDFLPGQTTTTPRPSPGEPTQVPALVSWLVQIEESECPQVEVLP